MRPYLRRPLGLLREQPSNAVIATVRNERRRGSGGGLKALCQLALRQRVGGPRNLTLRVRYPERNAEAARRWTKASTRLMIALLREWSARPAQHYVTRTAWPDLLWA